MELACDPLDCELFEQEHACAYEEGKKELGNQANDIFVPRRCAALLARKDQGLKGYPACQSPAGEGNISVHVLFVNHHDDIA